MSERFSKQRRQILKAALTGVAVVVPRAGAQATAAAGIVKAGDVLVYQEGPNAKKPIKLADLKEGQAVAAFVMDPKTREMRDLSKGSVVLVRLKPSEIKESSKPNAAGGVVAYSAICTHQGCPSRELGSVGAGKGQIICTCHGSLFDPKDNAKVLGGPAPRRLPALPLKAEGGQLVATGDFKGRVGAGK